MVLLGAIHKEEALQACDICVDYEEEIPLSFKFGELEWHTEYTKTFPSHCYSQMHFS